MQCIDMNGVGRRVRALRERAGYTQVALGAAIHVEQTTISNIETGYSNPSLKVLVRLARVFGVTLDEMFSETDVAESTQQIA